MTQTPNSISEDDKKKRAFLVIDGAQVYIIDQPVINIGRKKDNHIVIDNEHVSRYHAQIRVIKERYIVVDLNSTVGTSVNGNPMDQTFLKPGDVISLGGVPLIFGLGTPKNQFETSYSDGEKSTSTGPTDAADIQSADRYLDLFNKPDE